MTALPPPRIDAIDAALRIRRQQLAQALVPQLGTRVRAGVLRGLDLGSQLLRQPAPLARVLGLAHAAWLDHVLALSGPHSGLLHLGAADGFLAAGLLQARCAARAWVEPDQASAARALADDCERQGLHAVLQPLPPQPPTTLRLDAAREFAALPHLLCVAEDVGALAAWLAETPPLAWQHCTAVWPAGAQQALSPDALALLHARFGPQAGWRLLDGAGPESADDALTALDTTDRALVRADAGPLRWWCAQAPAVPVRRRALVCTNAQDRFIPRLLDTVRWDAHEPFDLDVLVYRDADAPAQAEPAPALAHAYPPGVRVFQIATTLGADGVHAMDGACQVLDAQGCPVAAAGQFFSGYERFLVFSIERLNAGLLQWLSAHHGRERLMLLVSDDEVDLRYKAQQYLATNRADLAAVARERFPAAMEQAFECVRHFWVVRDPWEEMLRVNRRNDLVVHPMVLPIRNDLASTRGVRPPDDAYVLLLHPKPSLPRDVAMAQLEAFLARWQVDRPLRVLTLRNDLATTQLALPGGRGTVRLQVFQAPLPIALYFELMAGCHGLVLVPRGGMTSIREAVRLGLDLFDDGSPFSPNRSSLRNLGLHLWGADAVTALHGQHVSTPDQRHGNQRLLALHEHAAVASFRRMFIAPGPLSRAAVAPAIN